VPKMYEAGVAAAQADIFVIIGTSLNVYPAAGLVGYTTPGTPIYLIDPKPQHVPQGVTVLQMGASEGMRQLTRLI